MERLQSKRRMRIMRAFKLREISCVDNPAQAHARMVIMKRIDAQQEHDNMQFHKIGDHSIASFDDLESAMRHLMDSHKCDRLTAMEQVGAARPDLVREFNDVGEAVAKSIADARAPRPISKAITDFNKRVAEVMARDRCAKLDALERARVEHPAEFAKYQEA